MGDQDLVGHSLRLVRGEKVSNPDSWKSKSRSKRYPCETPERTRLRALVDAPLHVEMDGTSRSALLRRLAVARPYLNRDTRAQTKRMDPNRLQFVVRIAESYEDTYGGIINERRLDQFIKLDDLNWKGQIQTEGGLTKAKRMSYYTLERLILKLTRLRRTGEPSNSFTREQRRRLGARGALLRRLDAADWTGNVRSDTGLRRAINMPLRRLKATVQRAERLHG